MVHGYLNDEQYASGSTISFSRPHPSKLLQLLQYNLSFTPNNQNFLF